MDGYDVKLDVEYWFKNFDVQFYDRPVGVYNKITGKIVRFCLIPKFLRSRIYKNFVVVNSNFKTMQDLYEYIQNKNIIIYQLLYKKELDLYMLRYYIIE